MPIDLFQEIFKNDKITIDKLNYFTRLFIINTQPSHVRPKLIFYLNLKPKIIQIKQCPFVGCEFLYKLPEDMGEQKIKVTCPKGHTFCHKVSLHNICNYYLFTFYIVPHEPTLSVNVSRE